MHDDFDLPEHSAVLHLLTTPSIRTRTAVHLRDGDVDWLGLLHETRTMSSGEALLVRIAHELWHASKDVGLWEITRKLDARAFDRVIEAFHICRGADALRPAGVGPFRLAV